MTDLSKDEVIERLRKALEEKDQLLEEKDQLLEETNQLLEEKNQLLEEKNQQIKAAKFFTNISIIYNDFNNNVASQAEVEGLLNDALEGCGFDEDIAESLVTYRNARKGEGAVIDTHDFARNSASNPSEAPAHGVALSSFSRGFLIGTPDDINYVNITLDLLRMKNLIMESHFRDLEDLQSFLSSESINLTKVRQAIYSREKEEKIIKSSKLQPLLSLYLNSMFSRLALKRKKPSVPLRFAEKANNLSIAFTLHMREKSKASGETSIKHIELSGSTDLVVLARNKRRDEASAESKLINSICHLELKRPLDILRHLSGGPQKNQLLGQTIGIGLLKDRKKSAKKVVRGILTDGFILYFLMRIDKENFGISHHILDPQDFILYLLFASTDMKDEDLRQLFLESSQEPNTEFDDNAIIEEEEEEEDDVDEEESLLRKGQPKKLAVKRKIKFENDADPLKRNEDNDDDNDEGGKPQRKSQRLERSTKANTNPPKNKSSSSPLQKRSSKKGNQRNGSSELNHLSLEGKENTLHSTEENGKEKKKKKKKTTINLNADDDDDDEVFHPFNASRLHLATSHLTYDVLRMFR
jgi:hypothetical protein